MRVLYLPTFWTIVVDSLAWAAIQMGIAWFSVQLPARWFSRASRIFRTRSWEERGAVYEKVFRVRRWKTLLPSGGALFRGGFVMRELVSREPGYLEAWVVEGYRAEICHWVAIAPSLLFFLWNPVPVGFLMIAYAIGFNAPCIIAQRYNRPRLLHALGQAKSRYGPALSQDHLSG